ncbi:MAG: hypothetical protein KAR01_00400 [Desulfocapsa sp.]|nr:hypothetical protein [Desulfocapsa sp.]
MNTKWKIILLVMLLIISICSVFTTLFYFDSQDNLTNRIDTEVKSIRAIVKTIEEQNNRSYRNRIKAFVSYTKVFQHEEYISAFARRDRKELLLHMTPYLDFFRQENPYFSTLAWTTPDNHMFLRACRPAAFGDHVGAMRADIIDANREERQYDGYMIAKRGLQYRLVQPVTYKGEHVGVVQFGIKGSQLLTVIHDKLNLPVGMVIPNENYSLVSIPNENIPFFSGSSFTVRSEAIEIFQAGRDILDWGLQQQKVTLQGKTYVVVNALELRGHKDEHQGAIFVALDISQQEQKIQSRIVFIVFLSSVLLLFSFLLIYFSYGSLIQKIVALNTALRESNENLENQVERRTEKLQKALDEIKSLEGILPLCSFCKKIRNDEEEWQEVDSYLQSHSQADVSHGICPDCAQKHYPDFV